MKRNQPTQTLNFNVKKMWFTLRLGASWSLSKLNMHLISVESRLLVSNYRKLHNCKKLECTVDYSSRSKQGPVNLSMVSANEVSPHLSRKRYQNFWREIRKIKLIKCPPNYTSEWDKNSDQKITSALKSRTVVLTGHLWRLKWPKLDMHLITCISWHEWSERSQHVY